MLVYLGKYLPESLSITSLNSKKKKLDRDYTKYVFLSNTSSLPDFTGVLL